MNLGVQVKKFGELDWFRCVFGCGSSLVYLSVDFSGGF